MEDKNDEGKDGKDKDDSGEGAKPKRSKRRCQGETEINEEDFPLLQCLHQLAVGVMPVAHEVNQFVSMIARSPNRACLARLRRGSFKKVLSDTWK